MSKKNEEKDKKNGSEKQLATILLATAILELIRVIFEFIENLIE